MAEGDHLTHYYGVIIHTKRWMDDIMQNLEKCVCVCGGAPQTHTEVVWTLEKYKFRLDKNTSII